MSVDPEQGFDDQILKIYIKKNLAQHIYCLVLQEDLSIFG
jgi:hypothetical protein